MSIPDVSTSFSSPDFSSLPSTVEYSSTPSVESSSTLSSSKLTSITSTPESTYLSTLSSTTISTITCHDSTCEPVSTDLACTSADCGIQKHPEISPSTPQQISTSDVSSEDITSSSTLTSGTSPEEALSVSTTAIPFPSLSSDFESTSDVPSTSQLESTSEIPPEGSLSSIPYVSNSISPPTFTSPENSQSIPLTSVCTSCFTSSLVTSTLSTTDSLSTVTSAFVSTYVGAANKVMPIAGSVSSTAVSQIQVLLGMVIAVVIIL
ncbi:hypothetical protein FOB63_000241 [Clavispora lusitaniae]|uniref:uncharacterized protein n=1 Tax=Clavispora lusitaniae TaxID=36911 RepID=UPI00202BD901|nr:hypothetical protein FOB63_000241 [Clavispora lusitaniae]